MNMRADIGARAYNGRTASIGFAHGPFVRVDPAPTGVRAVGAPTGEEGALRAAVLSASQQITTLAHTSGGEAAQILEFQVALLDDDEFLNPIFAAILGGTPADAAWKAVLDEQIAEYNSAPDEHLQARSSDLADLRDRVLRTLGGSEGKVLEIPSGAVVCAEDLPPVAISGGQLVRRRGARAPSRQSNKPRRHARPRPRYSDGRATGLDIR